MSVSFSKGEESKKKVLDAAFELFTEQGYEKTTMRQIIQKSGVLNGSVYHAFGNKDGVFEVVFNKILDKAFSNIDGSDLDAVTFLMLPASIELHCAYSDPILAEMLYHANRSWTIFNGMIDRLMNYLREYMDHKKWDIDLNLARRFFIATVSMTAGFVSEYHLTENKVPVRTNMKFLLTYVSAVVRVPLIDTDAALDKVCSILKKPKDLLKNLYF